MDSQEEAIADAIQEHQYSWIARTFGEDAAMSANYGAFITEDQVGLTMQTKVYGKGKDGGHGVLSTTSAKVGEFEDEWDGGPRPSLAEVVAAVEAIRGPRPKVN